MSYDFGISAFLQQHFGSASAPAKVEVEAAPGPAPVGPATLPITDAFVSAAASKLAAAQAAVRTTSEFVAEGAARAFTAVKETKMMTGREAGTLMRARNNLASVARASAANAERLMTAARLARGASLVLSAVELVQVPSDNPEQKARLDAEVKAAVDSGEWSCKRYVIVDVCGPTSK